jgi:hypothetical protein
MHRATHKTHRATKKLGRVRAVPRLCGRAPSLRACPVFAGVPRLCFLLEKLKDDQLISIQPFMEPDGSLTTTPVS